MFIGKCSRIGEKFPVSVYLQEEGNIEVHNYFTKGFKIGLHILYKPLKELSEEEKKENAIKLLERIEKGKTDEYLEGYEKKRVALRK